MYCKNLLLVILLMLSVAKQSAATCDCTPITTPSYEITVSNTAELWTAWTQIKNSGNATILLEDGTYNINDTFYISSDNIAFVGLSGNRDAVILKGAGMAGSIPHVFSVSSDNITIANLTLGWVYNHGIQVHGENDADNIHISNVRFVDTREQMLKVSSSTSNSNRADNGLVECSLFEYSAKIGPQYYIGGIDAHNSVDWIVRGNTFKYIRSPDSNLAEPAIHFWSTSTNTLVENNVIFDCDRGIGFGLGSSPHYGGTIRNNMVHTTRDVGIGLESASNVNVYHNTVYTLNYSNSIEYRFTDTTGGEIANNLTNENISSRDGGSATLNSNVTNAEPLFFTDISNGDLHLASDSISSVLNQATDIGITEDIDCDNRTVGASDIGADEYTSPPVTADVDGDGDLDLTDLITILKVLVNNDTDNIRSDYATSRVDVTGDNIIGQEEAFYVIQQLKRTSVISNSELRFTSELKEGATFILDAETTTDFGTAPTVFGYSDFRDQNLGSSWDLELEIGTARPDSGNGGIVYPGRGIVSRALDSTDTRIKINLPHVTEIFISRALKIRQGGTWPGSTGWPGSQPEPGVFPNDSTFKMSWLFAADDDDSKNDLCAPTHVGSNKLSIAGNSHNFSGVGANLDAVSHSGWSVVETWLRAEPANLVSDQGDGYIGVYSDQPNSIRRIKGTVFHPDKEGRDFVSVYVKGWIDKNGSEAVSFTDLYIASGAQRVVLADHHNLYLASKYVIQPHASWSGTKITGILRLGELDPATEPIYLHLFDADNNLVSAPLALANEIILPVGSSHSFGFDAPTSSKYIRNHLYVNQDSYQAKTGEIIRDMSLWVPGDSKNRTIFAIYENTDDDWKTATKVYEGTREPAPLEQSLEVSLNGAKKTTIHPLLHLTAGRYYWLACRIGEAYVIQSDGTGAQVLQGDGDLPTDMSEIISTLAEQDYKIGLNATVLD